MAHNAFEAAARRKKVAGLTRHVEGLVAMLGLTQPSDGYIIADLIRGWSDKEWNQAGINIGVKPKPGNRPLVGVESRLAVISGFIERARKVAS